MLPDRIQNKIAPEPMSGCWLWTGTCKPNGYAEMKVKTAGRWLTSYAHREIYKKIKGEIPVGLELDHKCRVRSCVNPDHLEPVTRSVNVRRGIGNRAAMLARTHCKRGHAFDEVNTKWVLTARSKRPTRVCRACNKLGWLAYRARQKDKGE